MAGNEAPREGQADGQAQGGMLPMVGRMVVMGALMLYMQSGKKAPEPSGPSDAVSDLLRPLYHPGEQVAMDLFLSHARDHYGKPVWHADVELGSSNLTMQQSISLSSEDLKPVLELNQSLFLVARFSKPGTPIPEPGSEAATGRILRNKQRQWAKSISLISHLEPFKNKRGKNLLSGVDVNTPDAPVEPSASPPSPDLPASSFDGDSPDGSPEDATEATELLVPHFKPNLTINFVNEFNTHMSSKMQPVIKDAMDISSVYQAFYPVVQISEFWLLRDYLVPLNSSVETVELHLDVRSISAMWWQAQLAWTQQFEMQQSAGLLQGSQLDELKRVLLEGNPYFLGLTMLVSLLHTVFDVLAFKNDIGFWQSNKSMEGLSARTVLINAVCQVIIFLYILDNETSMLIIGSVGIGMLIEFWKVTKVMNVSIDTSGRFPFWLKFADRSSYVDSSTRKWDNEATRYLTYAMIPCVIGYFIYSLVYESHKSWYSFVIETLVGFVYAFGFVLMCPQLYLNYKLKSVAHLPWRQMTYKFLNTIVDDLGAFIIKAPTLYRIAVFRDDVIFLIYVYQRWIYRVDKSRVNEFGFSDKPPEEVNGVEQPAIAAPEEQAPVQELTAKQKKIQQRKKNSVQQDLGRRNKLPALECYEHAIHALRPYNLGLDDVLRH